MAKTTTTEVTPEIRLSILREANEVARSMHYSEVAAAEATVKDGEQIAEYPAPKFDRLALRLAKRYLDFVSGASDAKAETDAE